MAKSRLSREEIQRIQRTKSGKLGEQQVAVIKWRLANGEQMRTLAAEHDVSLGTIRSLNRGDTWAWVKAQAPEAFGSDYVMEQSARRNVALEAEDPYEVIKRLHERAGLPVPPRPAEQEVDSAVAERFADDLAKAVELNNELEGLKK